MLDKAPRGVITALGTYYLSRIELHGISHSLNPLGEVPPMAGGLGVGAALTPPSPPRIENKKAPHSAGLFDSAAI